MRQWNDLGPLVICADLAELRAMLFPSTPTMEAATPPPAALDATTPTDAHARVGSPVGGPAPAPVGATVDALSVVDAVAMVGVPTTAPIPVDTEPAVPASPQHAALALPSSSLKSSPTDTLLRLGDLAVDEADHLVTWRGEPLALTRLERELLARLASSPVVVWSYEKLFASVWGGAYLGDSAILHSAVKRLRRKLRAVEPGPQIQTVRGVGYRLAVPLPTPR